MSGAALSILLDAGWSIEDLAVKAGDAVSGPLWHGELDIGHAEIDRAKPFLVGLIKTELITPRARRLDVGIMLLAVELGVREFFLGLAKALAKLLERGNNKTDVAAQHIRIPGRQMELAIADIDPHVVGAGEHERVAGQAECR